MDARDMIPTDEIKTKKRTFDTNYCNSQFQQNLLIFQVGDSFPRENCTLKGNTLTTVGKIQLPKEPIWSILRNILALFLFCNDDMELLVQRRIVSKAIKHRRRIACSSPNWTNSEWTIKDQSLQRFNHEARLNILIRKVWKHRPLGALFANSPAANETARAGPPCDIHIYIRRA